MKMNLTQRIVGLVGLMVVFMIAITVFSSYQLRNTIDRYRRLVDTEVKLLENTLDLDTRMHEARIAEMQFLLKPSPEQIEENEAQVLEMRALVDDISKLESRRGDADAAFSRSQVLSHVDAYATKFRQVAEAVLRKGKKDDGIIGEFRVAVHNVEDIFEEANNVLLQKGLLMLRRHEKDYLLRGEQQYIRKNADQVA
jgi:methyl-accepting chemotaxis protein